MKMKAIADKRKPKQKSEIPYRLKSAIDNHTAIQRREETASNESAAEQTQQAAGEVVYRAAQVPPQIQHAICNHMQTAAKTQRVEDQQAAPVPKQEPQAHNTPRLENVHGKASFSSNASSAAKGQNIDRPAPRQKPQATPKTKQYIEKQAAAKHIRPEKSIPVKAKQTIAQRTAELGRRRFQKNVQKQTVQQAQMAVKTTGAVLEKVGAAIGHAAKAVIGWLVGLVGGVGLVVILCLVLLVAAVAASPFGIFFANNRLPMPFRYLLPWRRSIWN